ncbi:MAG: hypothetical protein MUF18_04070 [Fimbriiglobus sp.]|jgi:GH24 family phage-related lysozyme (muramidase)|nr:hypothetical protein [Fimbriiglobus sp.]
MSFSFLSGLWSSLVGLLLGVLPQVQTVQVYEVWHTPKGKAAVKYADAPNRATAETTAEGLRKLGGTAEVKGPVNKVVAAAAPAAELTWENVKRVIRGHEGDIPHMYLDTKGYVTVAVGQLVSSAAEAQKLTFINRATGKPATAEEIAADFAEVSKQTKGMVASKYRQYTKLDMPEDARSKLYDTRVAGFLSELKGKFPDYDNYPVRVRGALLDMAFNLGTNGLVTKFPSFTAAIKAKDWAKAAKESNRPDVSAGRNSTIRQWLEDQVAADKAAKPK